METDMPGLKVGDRVAIRTAPGAPRGTVKKVYELPDIPYGVQVLVGINHQEYSTVFVLVKQDGAVEADWYRIRDLGALTTGRCGDCGTNGTLVNKGDHHGGTKNVCIDRDMCNARNPS